MIFSCSFSKIGGIFTIGVIPEPILCRSKYSSRISHEHLTIFACPVAISIFDPSLVIRSISPGIAKTSRPCSSASWAVMSVPLERAASGMRTPSEMPATISFRIGKL